MRKNEEKMWGRGKGEGVNSGDTVSAVVEYCCVHVSYIEINTNQEILKKENRRKKKEQ